MSRSTGLIVCGRSIDLTTLPLIGQGGEAKVYDLSGIIPNKVLKVYHRVGEIPDATQRKVVHQRLNELRQKLESFPKLPSGVASPEGMILKGKRVAAIVVPKISGHSLSCLLEFNWRRDHRFTEQRVLSTFAAYGQTIKELHLRKIVVGDIKPENVIVSPQGPIIIDSESFQFGPFRGRGFTPDYVDPLISWIDKRGRLCAASKFSVDTDWFAFGVMLFQALTFVSPYGGQLWAKKCATPITDEERPFKGFSVFRPEVTVPKFARVKNLSTELRSYFEGLFSHQHRKPFPLELLGGARSSLVRCVFHPVPGGLTSVHQL